ncbi:hypothetical protein PENTCL1PPCAC_25249, partial [Pristionchus entomophagus]
GALKSEIEEKGDIILVDTEDSYMNLVYKAVITFFISQAHCPTPFLLKIDQDVVFNVDKFMDQVGSTFHSDHPVIYCRPINYYVCMPYRDPRSAWYVSFHQYSEWFFPNYCSGPAYVLTSHAVNAIMKKLHEFDVMTIEDVFFTGIVARAADVKRIPMAGRFRTNYNAYSLVSKLDCPGEILAVHDVKTEEDFRKAWELLSRDC